MTRKPVHITFTGADDRTDIEGMRALSAEYPIEWGILFSPTRQGIDQRYPGQDALSRLLRSDLHLAAHLCGGYARDVVEGRTLKFPFHLGRFGRAQVNHTSPDPEAIEFFQDQWGPRCIAQARGTSFPANTSIGWLFDTSGGRGQEPEVLPPYPGRLVGYAGGIGPDNVLTMVKRIAATGPYWIDMESKVRTNNWFDLELCRQVCEAVYDISADKVTAP